MTRSMILAAPVLGLAACMTPGGPGASSYFECSNGAMLQVTYGPTGGANVQVDGGAPILLRPTPANSGAIYENEAGWRLAVNQLAVNQLTVNGGQATWSGRTREAPATCTSVAVPR